MTREEKIIEFIQRTRFWLVEQGEKINDLENRGGENQEEWNQIMTFVEESGWVITTVFDPTYTIVQDDGITAAYNFLSDWTDGEVGEFMSYWETRWGVGESQAVSLPLSPITLVSVDIGAGGGGITLPPGGQPGDRLVNIGGGQLGWETPATVFDMTETT